MKLGEQYFSDIWGILGAFTEKSFLVKGQRKKNRLDLLFTY